jgi:hypothetical protein
MTWDETIELLAFFAVWLVIACLVEKWLEEKGLLK